MGLKQSLKEKIEEQVKLEQDVLKLIRKKPINNFGWIEAGKVLALLDGCVQQIRENLDEKFKDWLSINRWINSDMVIGAWKRDEIKKGLLEIVNKEFLACLVGEAEKGKAGRVYSLTENGKKTVRVCEKFVSDLEEAEKEAKK